MESPSKRIDIRVPHLLLTEIDEYREKEGISNRTTAMFELIRIGLNGDGHERIKVRGESQRIDVRVPLVLLKKIEHYQLTHHIPTRTGAMLELTRKGLNEVNRLSTEFPH